ncbi:MAG TPA: hypothetical protein VGM54_07565 [Chthoniobacter sp.]
MPPLRLTAEHKRLLASVSAQPRTALDYYMLLPQSYFRNLPDSRERRVTYITTKTLTNDFLDAFRGFDCSDYGFHVTLKLYHTASRTFIVIDSYNEEVIFAHKKPHGGEPSISIVRPSLWLYADGVWIRQPDESLPKIPPRRVLAKYHHDWDADQRETEEEKVIWLDYEMSPTTDDIVLVGGENFQTAVYEYARLKWRDGRFSFK